MALVLETRHVGILSFLVVCLGRALRGKRGTRLENHRAAAHPNVMMLILTCPLKLCVHVDQLSQHLISYPGPWLVVTGVGVMVGRLFHLRGFKIKPPWCDGFLACHQPL